MSASDQLGAADEQARADWEDGEGAECATASGIWHAALAYERARVAAAGASDQPREAGEGHTPGPRYYVEPAYACNDLARVRKGAQDIIGYDVRDRITGLVEIPCETQEEADAECADLNEEGGPQ